MYDRILVPTDGSTVTEQAVRHGLGLARTYDATVHALYVIDESEFGALPGTETREQLRASAEATGRSATAHIADLGDEFGISVEREHRRGTPYEEILGYVNEADIDLVAMGTHGQAGVRSDLGSTTLRVIRNLDVPALTVRFRDDVDVDLANHRAFYDDILVATDGSAGAMAAAEQGIDVAAMYGATVHALYVLDTNIYAAEDVPRSIAGMLKESGNAAQEEIKAMGQEHGVDVEMPVRRGRPSEKLLDYVTENDIDLVTLGAHGLTSEVHLGSTTERVIRTSPRPTLSVR